MGDLNIISLHEYILSHGELAKQPNRGESGLDNAPLFKLDFRQGVLSRYKGTYVVYHKGVLCGQSQDRELLFKKACSYYGKTNLAVFKVPESQGSLEAALKESVGEF